jgi:hypothetical protein
MPSKLRMSAPPEQSQPLLVPSAEGPTPLHQAGQVLKAFLADTGLGTRNHRGQVLSLLAQHVTEGEPFKAPLLPTAYFKQAIAPAAGKEPSAWMAPLWARLLEEESSWQTGLIETARRNGSDFVPRLVKKDSVPALYGLEAVPVPPIPEAQPTPVHEVPTGGVRYTTEQATTAAAWLRWWMRGGSIRWTVLARVAAMSVYLVVVVIILMLLLLGMARSRAGSTAVTFNDLWLLVMLASFGWIAWQLERFFSALFDLRIVMAPLIMTRFADHGVTLELRRGESNQSDETLLVLSKYSALCPRCAGNLAIAEGGQAFPDRLVGRCGRAPREHIYSFDPVLRIGAPLLSDSAVG